VDLKSEFFDDSEHLKRTRRAVALTGLSNKGRSVLQSPWFRKWPHAAASACWRGGGIVRRGRLFHRRWCWLKAVRHALIYRPAKLPSSQSQTVCKVSHA